jgi:hypothetical protein
MARVGFRPIADLRLACRLQSVRKGPRKANRVKGPGLAAALLAIVLAQPAAGDVIVPGPPLVPISLNKSQVAKMSKLARAAVTNVFDFSITERAEYLNEAYRAAGKQGIVRVNEIVSVSVVGHRAFVLAVTDKWLAPQTIGPVYSYFQCKFDEKGQVISIDIV